MPIRPELRHLYRTAEYREARARVIERAGNKCEQCGKRNRRRVWVVRLADWLALRFPDRPAEQVDQFWSSVKGDGQCWRACSHADTVRLRLHGADWNLARQIRVILCCAHLDHDPTNNALANLRALCQWCHLNHDRSKHRQTRVIRKDAARPICAEGAIAL